MTHLSGKLIVNNIIAHLSLLFLVCLSDCIHLSQQTDSQHDGCSTQFLNVIVIDAGSTGTRLYETKFKYEIKTITIVQSQTYKVSPGLSAFENNPAAAGTQISNLLNRAKMEISPQSWKCTGIAVRATAGLRQLSQVHQDRISGEVKNVILKSGFKHNVLKEPFAIMSGEEEGYLSWFGVNFLLRSYNTAEDVGLVEMGGGSSQLAYKTLNSSILTTSYPIGSQTGKLGMLGTNSHETICIHPQASAFIEYGASRVQVYGKQRNAKLIDPQSVYQACYQLAQSVVINGSQKKTLHVDRQLRKPFFAVSSFYYTALNAHLFKVNDAVKSFTVGSLINAAKLVCAQPPERGEYAIFLCMDLVLQYALLKDGFGFENEDLLLTALKIDNFEIGWAVGLAAEMALRAFNNNT